MSEWRPIKEFDEKYTEVIIASLNVDGVYVVGEAYLHPDEKEWYWANISPYDYHGGPCDPPSFWQPLPSPPTEKEPTA